MTRAALRMADQRGGRVPDRCVRRGTRTEGAVHAWAVELVRADVLWAVLGPLLRIICALAGRASMRVVLPLSADAWSSLRRGMRRAVAVGGLGAGALALGVVRADAALAILGSALLAIAWSIRGLVLWRRWVGLVLRPGGEEVALSRVSPEFAEAARTLFAESVLGAGRR